MTNCDYYCYDQPTNWLIMDELNHYKKKIYDLRRQKLHSGKTTAENL
jgi:hypothetical protein